MFSRETMNRGTGAVLVYPTHATAQIDLQHRAWKQTCAVSITHPQECDTTVLLWNGLSVWLIPEPFNPLRAIFSERT